MKISCFFCYLFLIISLSDHSESIRQTVPPLTSPFHSSQLETIVKRRICLPLWVEHQLNHKYFCLVQGTTGFSSLQQCNDSSVEYPLTSLKKNEMDEFLEEKDFADQPLQNIQNQHQFEKIVKPGIRGQLFQQIFHKLSTSKLDVPLNFIILFFLIKIIKMAIVWQILQIFDMQMSQSFLLGLFAFQILIYLLQTAEYILNDEYILALMNIFFLFQCFESFCDFTYIQATTSSEKIQLFLLGLVMCIGTAFCQIDMLLVVYIMMPMLQIYFNMANNQRYGVNMWSFILYFVNLLYFIYIGIYPTHIFQIQVNQYLLFALIAIFSVQIFILRFQSVDQANILQQIWGKISNRKIKVCNFTSRFSVISKQNTHTKQIKCTTNPKYCLYRSRKTKFIAGESKQSKLFISSLLIKLQCGHIFHAKCWQKWSRNHRECPNILRHNVHGFSLD